MKESLKLLGIKSSGLDEAKNDLLLKYSDEELLARAQEKKSNSEKIAYLKGLISEDTPAYPESKKCLVELIKSEEPKLACGLILSICRYFPSKSEYYLLFAEVAFEHNALDPAKSALNVVQWLCSDKESHVLEKAHNLLNQITKKVSIGITDNSKNELWFNKNVDKYWILERLYYRAEIEKIVNYCFKLLDLFPDDLKNYEVVFRIFSLIDNEKLYKQFVEYIEKSQAINIEIKELYIGLGYYGLDKFNDSLVQLKKVLTVNKKSFEAQFYIILNYLMLADIGNVKDSFNRILAGSEPYHIAMYMIFGALSDLKIDDGEFPDQKRISNETAKLIEKLMKNNQVDLVNFLLKQFEKHKYYIVLPYLFLYLAEVFIRLNNLEMAKKVLMFTTDSDIHRLYSWIYRLEGNEKLAEEELIKYRKSWLPEKDSGIISHLINLDLPKYVPDDLPDIFNCIKNAYEQTKELINKIDLEYGLNAMTCIEATCQDCCTKTFPYVSYIEYFYIKTWLDSQNPVLLQKVSSESKKIVKLYKDKYKKDPPFMCGENIDQHAEYPMEFLFSCPFLGDNKCNIYEVRPFTCRAYGFSSLDGVRYKGCNYFFEQLKSATKINSIRKVVNMASFFNFAKLVDEKLVGKRIIAPLPVWFAQSYDETVEIVKKIVSSSP